MGSNRNWFQRLSLYSGVVSFVLALGCIVVFYLKLDELGFNHPVSASLLASTFFFIFVGVVLLVMAKSNLPSLKLTLSDEAPAADDTHSPRDQNHQA